MKEIQHKSKKRFLKNLVGGAIGLAILGLSYITISNSNDKNYLKPEDFNRVGWIEFDNHNGRIWTCYANEDIKKNRFNWYLYIDEVREKNKNNLERKIWLPDLDGDGKVGK